MDDVIVLRKMRFSQRFSEEFKIPIEKLNPFFENEFKPCLIGKADLKEEIKKYLKEWGWKKSADDLLEYWFKTESSLDKKMLDSASRLRQKGINCYLCTNQEKYRVNYNFKKLGLNKYFDGIFYSAKIGHKKQEPEFWQEVYKILKFPDKKTVLFWDNSKDKLEAAKEFGFNTELYTSFKDYENKIKKYITKN